MPVARDRLSPRPTVALFVGLRAFAPAGLLAPLPEPPGSSDAIGPDAAPQSLEWDAPPGCPSSEQVREAVATRIDPDTVAIFARVRADVGGALEADVEIVAASGATRRTLRSPACASIVDAIVLLAEITAARLPTRSALVTTSPAVQPPPTPRDEVEPVTTDAPAATPAPTPRASEPPRPRARVRARLIAGPWIGGGTLPRIDVGGRVAVGLAARRIWAELGALGFAPQRRRPQDGVEVQLAAWAAGARVCPTVPLPVAWLALGLCASAQLGAIEGRARGASLQQATAARQPWLRLGAGPELALGANRWVRGVVAVDVGGNPLRAGFGIAGLGTVWTPRPWAVHGTVALEVRLP